MELPAVEHIIVILVGASSIAVHAAIGMRVRVPGRIHVPLVVLPLIVDFGVVKINSTLFLIP